MRVLVTGASGFIGRALVRRLSERGTAVRALVRPGSDRSGLALPGVEIATGSLERPLSLAAALDECQAVVHLAGAIAARRARDFQRVNGEGTAHLARACAAQRHPPLLVHVSSLAAAGPAIGGRPRTEEDLPAPVSRYGESKLRGEQAVRALAERVPACILRPPVVYGPGDRALLPALAAMARLGIAPRFARACRLLSLVHVDDLCDAAIAALSGGERLGGPADGGVYFLDDGPPHRWEEVAGSAAAALGGRVRFATLPLAAARLATLGAAAASLLSARPPLLSLDKLRELRQPAWTCDGGKARRQLALAPPVPLAEGMRRAFAAGPAQPEPAVAQEGEHGAGA